MAPFSKLKISLRPWAVPGARLAFWTTTTSTTTSTSTTTDPNLFSSTTLPSTTTVYTTTTTVSTTSYTTTTVTPPPFRDDVPPVFTPYPGSATRHLLHTKFWPKHNDGSFISHADDRVRQQGSVTTSLSELVNSPPHESTGFPIGNSIESYQGFKTVEVWIRRIHLGQPDADGEGTGCAIQEFAATEGEWAQLYPEQNIEELKLIEWGTHGSSTWQVEFWFRTKTGSVIGQHRVSTYVHVAWHDSCDS